MTTEDTGILVENTAEVVVVGTVVVLTRAQANQISEYLTDYACLLEAEHDAVAQASIQLLEEDLAEIAELTDLLDSAEAE